MFSRDGLGLTLYKVKTGKSFTFQITHEYGEWNYGEDLGSGYIEPTKLQSRIKLCGKAEIYFDNKSIQDGGEAKAPLWLNRVGPAKWDWLTNWLTD